MPYLIGTIKAIVEQCFPCDRGIVGTRQGWEEMRSVEQENLYEDYEDPSTTIKVELAGKNIYIFIYISFFFIKCAHKMVIFVLFVHFFK